MKVTEQKLDENTLLLEALVSPAEVSHAFAVAQYTLAQQVGVTPKQGEKIGKVLEQQLGITDPDAVTQMQALEFLIPFAMDKRNIVPAYTPQAIEPRPLKRGESYTFQIKVTPKPHYELTSYDPVTISLPEVKITEEDVSAHLTKIAESYFDFGPAEPHPVGQDDCMLITLELSQNGSRIEELSSTEGRTYVMGMGLMPAPFEEQLAGMQVGETKEFSFQPPVGPQEKPLDPVDCVVTLVEMQQRVAPAITDEWVAENISTYESVEQLRQGIEERLNFEAHAELEGMKLQLAAAEISKRFEGCIEDAVYENTKAVLTANFKGQARQEGIPFERYEQNFGGPQGFDMFLMKRTREILVQGYALDAVYRHENLSIDDEDITAACMQINPQDPKTARRDMEESGRGFALRETAQRIKANIWVLENAIFESPEA